MTSIKRLPEDVHRRLRSGVVITDLGRIVEELVCNSLDSGATKIDVAVSIANCCVKVADNGSGISRDGLMLLGEQHATSKVGNLELIKDGMENFGFHGEALCSISGVSLMEILTKVHGKPNGYKKIIKNSKCLFLGISDDRNDVGTTVTVRDIFYNQQVRRKHMESSSYKVLNAVKMTVLRIALVHLNVSFKVVDRDSMDKLLHTQPSTSPSVLLSCNFGLENPASLLELNFSDAELKLSGFVSPPLDILSVKAIQYIYINSRFTQKGPIHKLMNQLAGKFNSLSSSLELMTNKQCEELIKYDYCSMFILNLCCPRSYYDVFTDEQSRTFVEFKDWIPVLAFIENGVMRLWTDSASGHRLMRCKTENFQRTLDLHSPKRKKLFRNNDVLKLNKPKKIPAFQKSSMGESLLYDDDYMAQFSFGSPASSSLNTGEGGLSSASMSSMLEFDTKIDDKSHFAGGKVSVSCPRLSDNIDFFRYPGFPAAAKSPVTYRSSEYGPEGFDVEQWTDCHDTMMTETDLAISGKDLWFDEPDLLQVSLGSDSEIRGSKCLVVDDATCSSFAKPLGFKDEFSVDRENDDFLSRNLHKRDEWPHQFHDDKRKIGETVHNHMEFFRGNGYRKSKRKGRSRRSSSAPPFHEGKKRYLDLAYSSTLSAKNDTKAMELRRQQQPFSGQAKLSPLERSARPSPEATCQTEPVESRMVASTCEIFKESDDAVDVLSKWDSSITNHDVGRSKTGGQNHQDSILDVSAEILHRNSEGVIPSSIDRESLQDARVLNQVDKKFIAVVAGNTVALIDQHAADERIRLEELRRKVLSGEMRQTVYLDAEQELTLPEIGYQLLHNYAEQIRAWGWTCNIQNSSSFTKNLHFFQNRPTEVKLLSVPSILDVKLTDIDLLEFLQQLSETDGSSTVPPSVLRILNNKACRGAIMFGDSLLPSECSLIVEELKQTSLCFQCAHGRPTTVPLIDMEVLRRSIGKLCPDDIPWHGLRAHGREISVEHSMERLRS